MASRRRKNSSLTTGMAIDGRASHLCHVCARDSARWYCAADEVYLCERCDTSVHNSNCISWRHERVRLGASGLPVKLEHGLSSCSSSSGSSLKSASSAVKSEASTGLLVTNFSSRNGSQKRPRTSWGKPHASYATVCSFVKEEIDSTAEESGVLREVPILLERWGSTMATEALHDLPTFKTVEQQLRTGSSDQSERPEIFPGFSRLSSSVEDLSSDEVISFVLPNDCCDVDSFLGDGFCDVDRGLRGILGEAVDADRIKFRNLLVPKIEEQEISESMSKELSTEISTDTSPDFSEEDYRIDLTDFEPEESSEAEGELEEEPVMKRLCLRLNYEDVLSAWSDRGSFWTDGRPPQTIPDDCTLDLAAKGWEMGFLSDIALGGEEVAEGEGGGGMAKVEEGEKSAEEGGNGGGGGAGREARVMRYREKRRTRLFSKKIRYEVRKLNAERRPRMKGRFVKRTLST